MATPDVCVVGGGVAGLAAAIAAAQRGASVVLLESTGALGGRARSKAVEGFVFNLGPHAWFTTGAAVASLRALGVPDPPGFVPTGGACVVTADDVIDLSFAALWRGEGPGLVAAASIAASVVGLGLRAPAGSVASWLHDRDPTAAAYLLALGRLTTYVNDPAHLPVATVAHQLASARLGVRYLDGGWGQLVASLASRAAAVGVTVRTRCPVSRVAAGAVALRDGASLTPGRVVVTGTLDTVADLCPTPDLQARRATARPARLTTLDLGLSALPVPERTFALGVDAPVYFSVHSTAAGLAPEGQVMAHAAWYRAPGDDADHTADLERLMDRVQPGWRDRVRARRVLRGVVVCSDPPAIERRRAAGADAGPGVTIAGDWVGPHHLADAALASGLDAGTGCA